MWDLIGNVLGGMLATISTGAALVGYVLWSRRRRMNQALKAAAAEAADQQAQRGGGGPTKPVVPK